jgi:5-bromo-4-chloroindolyl phosphate hydrolysis protein
MSEETKEQIESGIHRFVFPIIISFIGVLLTMITYQISNSLKQISSKMEYIEEQVNSIKIEGRDTTKDIQYINIRLQSIEADLREIKKNTVN